MKEQILDISLVLQSINGKIDGLTKQHDSAREETFVLKRELSFKIKINCIPNAKRHP